MSVACKRTAWLAIEMNARIFAIKIFEDKVLLKTHDRETLKLNEPKQYSLQANCLSLVYQPAAQELLFFNQGLKDRLDPGLVLGVMLGKTSTWL